MKKIAIIFLIIVFVALLIGANYLLNMNYEKENETYSEEKEIVNVNTETEEVVEQQSNDVIELSETEFEEKVLKADKKVVIDFYADWCGPCQIMSPIVEEVAKENEDVLFFKVNVDENEHLANQYRIFSIPTLILFENGEEADKMVGLQTKEVVIDFIK